MEQLLNEIRVTWLDRDTNRLLAAIPEKTAAVPPRAGYNQNEDFFFFLPEPLTIPRIPVHHDIDEPRPEETYMQSVHDLVTRLATDLPSVFQGLTYFFDPTETSKLSFFRLYKIEDSVYLYFFRIDLSLHPLDSEIVEAGRNDVTAVYRTNRLFAESLLMPLSSVDWDNGKVKSFKIRQLVSSTYMGEERRFYGRRGLWKDAALTKFFSRLVLPEGARTYPFFPLSCKFRTVCAEVPVLAPGYRRNALPILHRSIAFLSPEMNRIENSLKSGEFSDKMPLFAEMRSRVPSPWMDVFRGYATKAYLNDSDMKEFSLEVPDR
jgi:hypothetical protein